MKHFIISLVLYALVSACSSDSRIKDIDDLNKVSPEIEIIDSIVMSSIDSLGLKFKLTSPKLIVSYFDRVVNEEYPDGIDIRFYDKSNKSQSSITAGYAHVDEYLITTLKDNVTIKSDKGDILQTSQLMWDRQHRTIDTDKLIRLIQATGDTTFGFGLLANEDFSRFQIKRGYAGKVKFDDLKKKLGLEE